jgi:hypothetical protein
MQYVLLANDYKDKNLDNIGVINPDILIRIWYVKEKTRSKSTRD